MNISDDSSCNAPLKTDALAGQPVLCATMILAAALLLPGVNAAHAETAPERSSISLKYMGYRESQPGLDRVSARSPSFSLVMPLAGVWSIEGGATVQEVSGASPRYHTAVSGASKFTDARKAGNLSITRYFPKGTVTLGAAYSTESDYESQSLSLQGSVSSDDNNTTWTLGIGGADDKINPSNHRVVNEKKKTTDLLLGLTQVLGPRDMAQLNLTYVLGQGYFSDPYKSLDNRPRARNQTAIMARWNHHFPSIEGTTRLSYRFYSDTNDVRAHTFAGEYVQSLPYGLTVTPLLRLHSQSAARYYVDPVYDPVYGAPFPPGYAFEANDYLTQDQRQSAFGAHSYGVKLTKQIARDWSFDVKYENYQQRGSWKLFGQGSQGLAPFSARFVQLGATYLW
jgi:hypothetical protein